MIAKKFKKLKIEDDVEFLEQERDSRYHTWKVCYILTFYKNILVVSHLTQ